MEASTRAAPQLRPLGVGETLDAGFKIYKARFRTLVLCVLVPVVPITIVMILLLASVSDGAFTADRTFNNDTSGVTTSDDGVALAGVGITFLLNALMGLLATAACLRAVSAAYLGDDVTWQQSLRFGLRKLFPLVVATIVVAVCVFFGIFGFLIGAVFVFVRLAVVTPALVVEDIGPLKAVGRSWRLVKGRWWSTFGTTLIAYLLVGAIGQLIQTLLIAPAFASGDNEVLGATMTGVGQVVSNAITLPLQAAILTVLYYDLRVRKEGLDLALLAERFGSTAPADVARSSGLGGDDDPQRTYPGGFSAPQSPDQRDTT